MQRLAQQVEQGLTETSLRSFARVSEVDPMVLSRLLQGTTWIGSLPLLRIASTLNTSILIGPDLQRRLIESVASRLSAWTGLHDYRPTLDVGAGWAVYGVAPTMIPTYFDQRIGLLLEGVAMTTPDPAQEVHQALERYRLWEGTTGLKPNVALLLVRSPDDALLAVLHSRDVPAVWPAGAEFADNRGGALVNALKGAPQQVQSLTIAEDGTTRR
jgi:hypothetical protein